MISVLKTLLIVGLIVQVLPGKETQSKPSDTGSKIEQLTSHSDVVKTVRQLDEESDLVRAEKMGKSVLGRELLAMYFSKDKTFASNRSQKPLVLMFCQQHGNEPSGKEAALLLAKDLCGADSDLLNSMDLILVPQMNPDGSEAGKRRNANDMDLNRNHVILSEPESQALHTLFLKWMPEVNLDVHEYNAISKKWIEQGFVKDADEMLGGVSNLNIDERIHRFSKDIFIPETGQQIKSAGFSFHEYTVGAPFENDRIRYSTTSINDGRQSMGIYNTMSFLIEGKRYGDLTTNLDKRVRAQLAAMKAFLRTVGNHATEINTLVRTARKSLLQKGSAGNDLVHLKMDYFKDQARPKLIFPVFVFEKWQRVEMEFENFYPRVKVRKSVPRPKAYVFSADETRLIELLQRHQIKYSVLDNERIIAVEAYTVLHVTPEQEEDKSTEYVDVLIKPEKKQFSAGDIFVSLDQPAANLIPLLLEPQSSWGIVTKTTGRKYRFKEFLTEGGEYPVYRVVEDGS